MPENQDYLKILAQLNSVVGAIYKVEDGILRKHLEGCVTKALIGKSEREKQKKLNEVMKLIHKFRKGNPIG